MIRTCSDCGQKNRIPFARLAQVGRCGRCKAPLSAIDTPIEVDEPQFQQILSTSTVPVLVDFWAAWCGPCLRAAPEVKAAARALQGSAVVLKVNTEHHPAIASRYNVRGIPNFAVFRDGELVHQQPGLVSRDQLVAWVRAA